MCSNEFLTRKVHFFQHNNLRGRLKSFTSLAVPIPSDYNNKSSIASSETDLSPFASVKTSREINASSDLNFGPDLTAFLLILWFKVNVLEHQIAFFVASLSFFVP